MFYGIPNTPLTYVVKGRAVSAEAVCLMDWPEADGSFSGHHRLMVVHDDRDPKWLDVRETALYNGAGVQIPAWKLLNELDRKAYLYHQQKHVVGTKRAFFNTLGRDLRAQPHQGRAHAGLS